MADCAFDSALLQDFLDERLGGEDLRRVAAHLAECEHCRRLHASYTALDTLLGALPAEDAPALLVERVMLQVDQIREAPATDLGKSAAAVAAVLTAATVLFAFGFLSPILDPAAMQDRSEGIFAWFWGLLESLGAGFVQVFSGMLGSLETWLGPSSASLTQTVFLLFVLGGAAVLTNIYASGARLKRGAL